MAKEKDERINEKVKTRKVGNDSFTAKIVFNSKNRLKRIEFSRTEEKGTSSTELLIVKDKEELANLRSLLFRASSVTAKRVPYDYVGVVEEE
jgi:hypothetical protein